MKDMLEAGVHYGHQKRFWHPRMHSYIFGINHNIHIINLEETLPLFKKAINFINEIADKKGKILFVGTKRQAQNIIVEESIRCSMPYVNYRWLGGMLTNYKTIRQSIRRLHNLEKMRDQGVFECLTKKESLRNTNEIKKLERVLGGIKNMNGLPDAVVVIDSKKEKIAITEARRLGIPVVAIVDTNSDPDGIDYVIPGNDDAVKAIRFYLSKFADVIIDAKQSISYASPNDEAPHQNN